MVLTYNMNGFVSNLPNMTQGRRYHACTKYFNSDNEIVKDLKDAFKRILRSRRQHWFILI